jgi:hypothetical protein
MCDIVETYAAEFLGVSVFIKIAAKRRTQWDTVFDSRCQTKATATSKKPSIHPTLNKLETRMKDRTAYQIS